jgi:uncharacterized membrane protein YkvA (DUF1232 family)
MKMLLYLGAVLLGALYILNPTAGVLELIPDNLPFVGNLDEAAATAMVIWGVRGLRARKKDQKANAPSS